MSETPKQLPGPAQRDLLGLAMSPYPDIVEAFEEAYSLSPEEREQSDYRSVPPRMIQVGNILVAASVQLIRSGTREQLGEAAGIMSRSILRVHRRDPEDNLGNPYKEAKRQHSAAAVTLTAAIAASSPEGGYSVVRSHNGLAAKILCAIADAPGELHSCITLHTFEEKTGISPDSAHGALGDLECASLIECIPDGGTAYYLLGPAARSYGNPELLVLARHYAVEAA
ncbi:MAG TPA: hypothetical protein VF401_00295 [Candidatus Saccharimonadales bacterium]